MFNFDNFDNDEISWKPAQRYHFVFAFYSDIFFATMILRIPNITFFKPDIISTFRWGLTVLHCIVDCSLVRSSTPKIVGIRNKRCVIYDIICDMWYVISYVTCDLWYHMWHVICDIICDMWYVISYVTGDMWYEWRDFWDLAFSE